VDEDLSLGSLGLGLLFGSFDGFSVLESGSVADESDEVGCAGDLRAVSGCGEGRLDRYLEPTG
jgi:hypothetical protein